MLRYAARRAGSLVLVLLAVSVLVFSFAHFAPGDPATVILTQQLGQPPSRAEVARERHVLGLDQSTPAQYLSWLAHAVRGDLGTSWQTGGSVSATIGDHIPYTAQLAGVAALLAILSGVPIGVLAAWRRDTVRDHLSRAASLLGASLPNYFVAYVLIVVFGVILGVLPTFGSGSPDHLVLPAITLALAPSAVLMRLTRSAMLEALGEDYIRTADAKGLAPRAMLFRHALRNALNPIVTVIALMSAQLFAGSVIVETIFAWPGTGMLLIQAIHARDYPVIEGCVLLIAVAYVAVNFVADLAYGWLDPRIRVYGAEAAR